MNDGGTIGWIGIGRMGTPLLRRVLAAGHRVGAWARRPEALAQWLAEVQAPNLHIASDTTALAHSADILCTCLAGPDDVASLHAQLMPVARPGSLFIDLSTAAPATAAHAVALAERYGHAVVDTPLTGGVAGAERGTLTAFAGGAPAALERAQPLLAAFCSRVVPCGAAGSGYRTKLINQTMMVGALLGLADGARLARAAGYEPLPLRAALAGGTAASTLLDNYLQRMIEGNGAVSFTLALLHKDLLLARAEAQTLGVAAPLLDAALAAVAAARARHGDGAGLQVLAA